MQSDLSAFIKDNQLFTLHDHLLLGVSGGVDSMTLCSLLVQLDYKVSIAHMNFGLRRNDSDLDEALVREVGNALKIPVFTKKVATEDYADEHAISIQMAARELRYSWFNELVETHRYDYVLTAHNADDNLETVLFNLTKGTGIRGLRGIKAKDGNLARPLLFAVKSDIQEFAKNNAIKWREDASNSDTKYTRNKLRHEVLPVLTAINPSVLPHFEYTRLRLLGTEQVLMQQVNQISKEHCQWLEEAYYINLVWLTQQESDAVILSELLRDYGFTFPQCVDILKANDKIGKLFDSEKFVLNVDRDRYIVKSKTVLSYLPVLEIKSMIGSHHFGKWELTIREQSPEDFKKGKLRNEIFLDADCVHFPLILRRWENGDSFQPLGLHGKKKISDFLVDQKVPLIEKADVFVLVSGETICWVVNYRLDDRFKVTSSTRKMLKITCQKSFEDRPNTV